LGNKLLLLLITSSILLNASEWRLFNKFNYTYKNINTTKITFDSKAYDSNGNLYESESETYTYKEYAEQDGVALLPLIYFSQGVGLEMGISNDWLDLYFVTESNSLHGGVIFSGIGTRIGYNWDNFGVYLVGVETLVNLSDGVLSAEESNMDKVFIRFEYLTLKYNLSKNIAISFTNIFDNTYQDERIFTTRYESTDGSYSDRTITESIDYVGKFSLYYYF
jgi:hypothetical protein